MAQPEHVDVEVEKDDGPLGGERHKHPSFGMVRVGMCSGKAVLNGSSINHQHYFTLTVSRAEKQVEPHRDWWFGKEQLIEIKLSSNQLMDMLIHRNTSGIPCTLGWLPGEGCIPEPPQVHVRERMLQDLKDQLHETSEKIVNLAKEMEDRLNTPGTIKKKDKEDLSFLVLKIKQAFDGNRTFLAKCQEEHLEKVITQVAGEVETTVSNIIRSAGVEGLEKMLGPVDVPALDHKA